MGNMEEIKAWRCFGGWQKVFRHRSESTGTDMEFAAYLPPRADTGPVPVLYFLSGLTCTWENFTAKAGAQRYAAEHGLMLIAPDTSPRGLNLPGEDEAYDFGTGAGFYVDAKRDPWAGHYNMYSYVREELPDLVRTSLPAHPVKQGITGHSMGGHGALVCALRNPDAYTSVSAFAPIVNPVDVPWGQKAFAGYLGEDEGPWADYDASRLAAKTGWDRPILIDQGTGDNFMDEQLQPGVFKKACADAGLELNLRMQDSYDHSYYFIATFIGDHIKWHADALKG